MDDEKPSKKKPLLARALHKSIKRIKSNEFNPIQKKQKSNPKLDHQVGNSSFFKDPTAAENTNWNKVELREKYLQYVSYEELLKINFE